MTTPEPADVRVPAGLAWWTEEEGGEEWLARLPRLVVECAEKWSLELAAPFEPAHISYVAPVRADGVEAVLKINFPEPESEHEADALAWWNGDGAALLISHDLERRALLVESCRPGRPLWDVADEHEANQIAGSVLRRLWRPAPAEHRYRLLEVEARRWADGIPRDWELLGRRCERALIDEAVSWCHELADSQPELVVCHQDFHGGNVLSGTRQAWLAIDPKPLVGERAFDTASLVRDRRPDLLADPHPARRMRRRLDQLSAELGIDRERMRAWGIVHALAWGSDAVMVECARLLSEAK